MREAPSTVRLVDGQEIAARYAVIGAVGLMGWVMLALAAITLLAGMRGRPA